MFWIPINDLYTGFQPNKASGSSIHPTWTKIMVNCLGWTVDFWLGACPREEFGCSMITLWLPPQGQQLLGHDTFKWLKSCDHQLRLVVYPIGFLGFHTSQVVQDFSHQQYDMIYCIVLACNDHKLGRYEVSLLVLRFQRKATNYKLKQVPSVSPFSFIKQIQLFALLSSIFSLRHTTMLLGFKHFMLIFTPYKIGEISWSTVLAHGIFTNMKTIKINHPCR